jgi:general secretion pathway protein A
MYLDFYGFREIPFGLTPDSRFLFLSKSHREAFAHLLYGIQNRSGFIALTGEDGSGKTTVLRTLFSQLAPDHHRTALIFNPCLSPPELLQRINRAFGIPTQSSNVFTLVEALSAFLIRENAERRIVVLGIDEVQNLEPSVLEQVRLISNLETERKKLIQIVLSGPPEFLHILSRKDLLQLRQRIAVHYHLQPMDFQDTVGYIARRLQVAGRRGGAIFSKGALRRIYRYSRGVPRLVNEACDKILLAGYAQNKARITPRIAATEIRNMKKGAASHTRRRLLILIPTSVFAILLAVGIYLAWQGSAGLFNPRLPSEAAGVLTKKYPVPAGEEFSRDLAAELGRLSEAESARRAFNTLAGLWKARPVPVDGNWSPYQSLDRAAQERDLRLYRFSSSLGTVVRIGYPAALEIGFPGLEGKRFLSLVGAEDEKLLIAPPIAGKSSFSFEEMEKHWAGQGLLLWKDPLNLQGRISPGAMGDSIRQLQSLLQEAGAYTGPLTGVFDGKTLAALKKFQASRGIDQNGTAESQTLMLLYRSLPRFDFPNLAGRQR